MSASTLLVNGQIRASLIPASVVPENPEFQSLAIVPPGGNPGYLSIENDTGEITALQKNDDGSFQLVHQTAPSTFVDALLVSADASTITLGNTEDTTAVVVEATATATVSAPTVNLGDATDATPTVNVVGSAGSGQVYDERYNLPAKPLITLFSATSGQLVSGGPINVSYTPQQTGMYLFTVVVQFNSTATIGTGPIEYSLNIFAGAPNCNHLAPAIFTPYASNPSGLNIYSFTNPISLTAGTPVQLNITANGTGWQTPVYAYLTPLC